MAVRRQHPGAAKRLRSPAAPKASTGIAGIDAALRGGLPRGRATLVFGGPGSGKTVLALQVLANGVSAHDEPGIFVALEEDSPKIVANVASFGWGIPELQRSRRLAFVDAHLDPDVVRAGRFDLRGLLAVLSVKVAELGVKRVVFDGLDVLLAMLDDPAAERAELYRIHNWILEHRLTGIITAKGDGPQPFAEARYGFAAYMADCALLLSRRQADGVSERDFVILKYRGSGFAENVAPFVIGPTGIEVAEQDPVIAIQRTRDQRLSTGVPRLDAMLNGGFFHGASALITGLPGTAKSTLCGSFIAAACRRRDRALYVSFDELAEETVRNFRSVGIDLGPFVASGRLVIQSALSLTDSAEVQLMRIRATILQHRATCVVIDPISALAKSSNAMTARAVIARFIHWCKFNAITLVCTSLISSPDPHTEATDLGASTLCDTWIHLSYAQRGGERNRALTVIKSRGTAHSNQIRELVLTDGGITLSDVYQSGGEVLMGTARWEKENLERDAEQRLQMQARRRRIELERTQSEIEGRAIALERELAMTKLELDDARRHERERLEVANRRHDELLSHRHADRRPDRQARRRNGDAS